MWQGAVEDFEESSMPKLNAEPPVLTTMQAVLDTAARMEQEAIDGYRALRQRMLEENQPALADVFERLIAEEESHLHQVSEWAAENIAGKISPAAGTPEIPPMFDAEGADMVPAETLDAYRAFSTAVRNEERAFVFWSYVAAHAPDTEVRLAAEKMAHEELGHIATLRRERRQAFHTIRAATRQEDTPDLAAIEKRFLSLIEQLAGWGADKELEGFATETRNRLATVATLEITHKPRLAGNAGLATTKAATLCGILLDFYLDLMNAEKNEEVLDFSWNAASQLVRCLAALRSRPAAS